MKQFETKIIQKEGMDAGYIEIPFNVEEAFGSKRVKVKATFDGHPYRGSIVRMGTECHILGITKEIRTAIGKTFGDNVNVTVEKDEEERVLETPEKLQEAIKEDDEIRLFWESLSYSMRKKYIIWITSAKKEETKDKRIIETIKKLKNKEKMVMPIK